MPDQITIGGEIFDVPLRYKEGYEINAAEATALNQALHNALRNNWTPKVGKAKENGSFNKTVLQTKLTEYADKYQFGGRGPAPSRKDKIPPEAMSRAKAIIRADLKRRGISLRNVAGAEIASRASQYLVSHPELIQQALKDLQGTEDLSALVADMPVKG